jgi:TetR/AcrR family transcriptional repressor of nem operon
MSEQIKTEVNILEVAQRLIQRGGYNAFSYADIADAVGIRKASIHYYFPNKSDLGREVMRRYRAENKAELDRFEREAVNPRQKMELYFLGYINELRESGQVCLACMLAADQPTLPQDICNEVGAFQLRDAVEVEAQLIIAAVQGAMVIARSCGSAVQFETVAARLLDGLNN